MNAERHIDPFSSPDGDVSGSGSEFWGTDLALRIWLWLSQICTLGGALQQSPLAERLLGSTFLREVYSPFQTAQRDRLKCKEGHCGNCEAASAQTTLQKIKTRPERHRRRMIARRARGIMPITRYPGVYLRPLISKGLTPTQYLEAVLRISSLGRLQTYNWNYHTHAFFRRGAIKARAAMGRVCAQVATLCNALLSPD